MHECFTNGLNTVSLSQTKVWYPEMFGGSKKNVFENRRPITDEALFAILNTRLVKFSAIPQCAFFFIKVSSPFDIRNQLSSLDKMI